MSSGRVSDPTEDQISTVVVSLDENCDPSITEWKTKQPVVNDSPGSTLESELVTARPASVSATANNGFEPDTIWGNFIRSSQTLQDVFNVDIAKLKWTHDRQWNDANGLTRFKTTNENTPNLSWWGACSTTVSWNHVTGCWYNGANTTWAGVASSNAQGNFHTDWAWCNNTTQWQNLSLFTRLDSWPGGDYNAVFCASSALPRNPHGHE